MFILLSFSVFHRSASPTTWKAEPHHFCFFQFDLLAFTTKNICVKSCLYYKMAVGSCLYKSAFFSSFRLQKFCQICKRMSSLWAACVVLCALSFSFQNKAKMKVAPCAWKLAYLVHDQSARNGSQRFNSKHCGIPPPFIRRFSRRIQPTRMKRQTISLRLPDASMGCIYLEKLVFKLIVALYSAGTILSTLSSEYSDNFIIIS